MRTEAVAENLGPCERSDFLTHLPRRRSRLINCPIWHCSSMNSKWSDTSPLHPGVKGPKPAMTCHDCQRSALPMVNLSLAWKSWLILHLPSWEFRASSSSLSSSSSSSSTSSDEEPAPAVERVERTGFSSLRMKLKKIFLRNIAVKQWCLHFRHEANTVFAKVFPRHNQSKPMKHTIITRINSTCSLQIC